jgi:hypothetical protein
LLDELSVLVLPAGREPHTDNSGYAGCFWGRLREGGGLAAVSWFRGLWRRCERAGIRLPANDALLWDIEPLLTRPVAQVSDL